MTRGDQPTNWPDEIRRTTDDLRRRRREAAAPDCRICHGTGETHGYVGPGKEATYACPCTGTADWQR